MAKVTITFEDTPEPGEFGISSTQGDHITITLESADPPLPIMTVTDPKWIAGLGGNDKDLDVEAATAAQVAARMAVGEVAGQAGAAEILTREP